MTVFVVLLIILCLASLLVVLVLSRWVRRVRTEVGLLRFELADSQQLAEVGSIWIDLVRGVESGTDELFRLLGIPPVPELAFDAVLDTIAAADRPRVEVLIADLARNPDAHDIEVRIVQPDGAIRWAQARVRGTLDATGSLIGIHGIVRDITDQRELEQQLSHDALHDPLTGLANRVLLRDRIGGAMGRAEREAELVAILLIDLDGFKLVNDTFGHEAGDRVLRLVADRLRSVVRPADTAARLGGDEFAVVVETTTVEGVRVAVRRLLGAIRDPFEENGTLVRVNASIGVACCHRMDDSPDAVLRRADLAMYAAKRSGRGGYRFFQPVMEVAVSDRLRLDAELREAIDQQQFTIHYQPIVLLASGRITGFEALARWSHPTDGTVGPDRFIRGLEDSGLIVGFGGWALMQACRQVAAWQKRFALPLSVSVNVSPHQFHALDLVDRVSEALEDSTLSPTDLVIEITENVMMGNSAEILAQLHAIDDLGVHLAIDDFGTGYSSLSYLQRLPVDVVKIDQSFVAGICDNAEQEALVRAILTVGDALRLGVVAEGIESTEQADLLHGYGCRLGQGYHFGRPLPAADIEAVLDATASR